MKRTPEGRVKDEVGAVLEAYGAYYHMPVQNGMGSRSLDFVGCYAGRFFAIETKAAGREPTALQYLTMQNMLLAGAAVFVIIGEGQTHELRDWLENPQRTPKAPSAGDGRIAGIDASCCDGVEIFDGAAPPGGDAPAA